MATLKPFTQAGFLNQLDLLGASVPGTAGASLPAPLTRILLTSDGHGEPTPAAAHLIQLLKAKQAMLQAAFDTELVADELRRYQKFAKPGQPSPHIVQLRQQQALARQSSSHAKQWFIRSAAAFVRDAGIQVPSPVALEVFINHWIEANVPT